MEQFEAEIWADKQKMKRVLIYIGIITALAWIAHVLGNMFWDEYSKEVYSFRYHTNVRKGWPVNLYWWGFYLGVIGPVSFLTVYFVMNKKLPSLALNKQGLFVNQQLIKQAMVPWKDVARVEKVYEKDSVSLEIYFKNVHEIIKSQSSAKQAFLKENFKDGKPLKCDNRLSVGDFESFANKANEYLQI